MDKFIYNLLFKNSTLGCVEDRRLVFSDIHSNNKPYVC